MVQKKTNFYSVRAFSPSVAQLLFDCFFPTCLQLQCHTSVMCRLQIRQVFSKHIRTRFLRFRSVSSWSTQRDTNFFIFRCSWIIASIEPRERVVSASNSSFVHHGSFSITARTLSILACIVSAIGRPFTVCLSSHQLLS